MGIIVTKAQPCLDQTECRSSDARQIYEDGTSYCFSCSTFFKADHNEAAVIIKKAANVSKKDSIEDIKTLGSRGFKERGIIKIVSDFFNVKVTYGTNGEIDSHYYPYSNGGYKHRILPKSFTWAGESGGLFGKDNFNGGGKRLIITEGEIDAMSISQAYYDKYKKFYPVVSIPSASGTKELLSNRDWIRSFQEVVLCLDNDKAGQEATEKALRIIGIDKVKLCKLPLKDANEILLKLGGERLLQCVWDAATWSPVSIIKKEALWQQMTERNNKPSTPYPPCLAGINSKLKGMRDGEITLFISGTGAGKSTIAREIELHIVETTDEMVGIMSFEETPAETGQKLSGMSINKNPSNEEIPINDLRVGFDAVFGKDRILILDHQGSLEDSELIDQLEYMCLMGCKKIIIDHITILVSEGAKGLSGNEAQDRIMNDLLRLVKKYPVWICLISHLRKSVPGGKSFEEGRMPSVDDIKGSGSIKQVSMDIVAFSRNTMAVDVIERNSIAMAVLKCRHTGLTGPVPGVIYNVETGRLTALTGLPGDSFTEL